MPSELDIYRSAAVLIEHYGENAKIEAAKRADGMLAKGNLEGHRVWLAICKAIDELHRTSPQPGERIT